MFTPLLIGLAALIALGAGVVLKKKRAALPAASARKQLTGRTSDHERTLRELRRGDIVQRDGSDFVVEGVVRYDEDGHRWLAGRLTDANTEQWLLIGIERAGTHAVQWLSLDQKIRVSGHPPEVIATPNARYVLGKRGTATASLDGLVGDLSDARELTASGTVARCRWWQYEAVGGEMLYVERWGDDFRVLSGESVHIGMLGFLPGS